MIIDIRHIGSLPHTLGHFYEYICWWDMDVRQIQRRVQSVMF